MEEEMDFEEFWRQVDSCYSDLAGEGCPDKKFAQELYDQGYREPMDAAEIIYREYQ